MEMIGEIEMDTFCLKYLWTDENEDPVNDIGLVLVKKWLLVVNLFCRQLILARRLLAL